MKIIQITDIHINPKDELVNGVDTRKNFLKVLEEVSQIDYDFVVFSGDLSFQNANPDVYKWIMEQLKNYKIEKYRIIPGNHDESSVLAKSFGIGNYLHGTEMFYTEKPNYLFLDTALGYCSDDQWKWIDDTISNIDTDKMIVFMHHPPFKAGVPHMDGKYSFQQSEQFEYSFSKFKGDVFVLCGHYHNEIFLKRNNINIFITPSTYLQISNKTVEFNIEHRVPGYRVIEILNNEIKTSVKYVFDK